MQTEYTIIEKPYTPIVNAFFQMVLESGPSPEEHAMLIMLAMMDETYQVLLGDSKIPDAVKEKIELLYEQCEMYLDTTVIEQ